MDSVHAGGLGGTYSGNPVACAAAFATIATMAELGLASAARRIGDDDAAAAASTADRHAGVGDVRGRGAMIAVELVRPGTKEPDPQTTKAVAQACHAAGLLVLTAGTYGNVLRFLPPMVMPEHLLAEGLDVLEGAFTSSASLIHRSPSWKSSKDCCQEDDPGQW